MVAIVDPVPRRPEHVDAERAYRDIGGPALPEPVQQVMQPPSSDIGLRPGSNDLHDRIDVTTVGVEEM